MVYEDAKLVSLKNAVLTEQGAERETKTCPCCGSVIPNPIGRTLSPSQRKVYFFVARHAGCTWQDIADHIYSDRADGGALSARLCIATFIYHANRRLTGQRIVCTGGPGATYRLVKIEEENAPT